MLKEARDERARLDVLRRTIQRAGAVTFQMARAEWLACTSTKFAATSLNVDTQPSETRSGLF
jgi:hypothetical protein